MLHVDSWESSLDLFTNLINILLRLFSISQLAVAIRCQLRSTLYATLRTLGYRLLRKKIAHWLRARGGVK